MRIVKAKEVGEREVERLLTKAAFDEVELNPKIREGNKKLFGRDMSAAELVRMIVNDVRKDGDKAVMHYTKLIDKVDLTPENMLVSEEEFAERRKTWKPRVNQVDGYLARYRELVTGAPQGAVLSAEGLKRD